MRLIVKFSLDSITLMQLKAVRDAINHISIIAINYLKISSLGCAKYYFSSTEFRTYTLR